MLRSYRLVRCLLVVCAATFVTSSAKADSPWLYGIHWYGDAWNSQVETMTGGKGIWSLETVQTDSDLWWSAQWQRDNRFGPMVSRGHTIICRIERNWGETVPYPGNLPDYLTKVQAAATVMADVCHIWQIGNEMNIYNEYGGNALQPADYVDMYRQIRAAIKSVPSPLGEQIVLLGPPSPGEPIGGVRFMDGNEYLAAMCSLLQPNEVDGFGIHTYAGHWNNAPDARREVQAGYMSQLAVIDTHGFTDKPVYVTEWNRYVEPINDYNEAQSAQLIHGAFSDLHNWNQMGRAHDVTTACWFIYKNDPGWGQVSIEYLHGIGPSGQDNDLFDAFQYSCTQDLTTSYPVLTPALAHEGTPPGVNVASQAASATADSGDASAAIDGVVSYGNHWGSDGSPPYHWLQLDLGREFAVTGYTVHHATGGGGPGMYNTETFQIETAPTASGPWQVDVVAYTAGTADSTLLTYYTPRSIRHVRLVVTDPGVDNTARIPEFEVFAPAPLGDFDGDGDVDFDDAGFLWFCMQGPDHVYVGGHVCRDADFDEDADVDLADFAVFAGLFGG